MLLCRLAENAYWMGRYLERAEDLARAMLAYEEIRLDLPGQRAPGWRRLASLTGVTSAEAAHLSPAAFAARVVIERGNPSSVLGAVHAARENLRRARALFPAECWHTLNALHLRLSALHAEAPPAVLRESLELVVCACRELAGHVAAGMLRDDLHAFLRLGFHLERADMTLRVATIVADSLIPQDGGAPFEDVRWIGLLKSVGAYGTYRHRYHAATDFPRALELLLSDPKFPRSFAHVTAEVERDLARLPASEAAREALEACRAMEPARSRAALPAFAKNVLERLAHLSAVLESSYFVSSPAVLDSSSNCDATGAAPPRVHQRHLSGANEDHREEPEAQAAARL